MRFVWCLLHLTLLSISGCWHGNNPKEESMKIRVTSSAFDHEGIIPPQYTCDGDDISPPLKWEFVPEEAKSTVIICDDPDAPSGTWVHWVAFNLPPEITQLREQQDIRQLGGIVATNSWDKQAYGGPCPPSGTHRYYFNVYALDTKLSLDTRATKEEVVEAMQGHILAQGALMGKYQRI